MEKNTITNVMIVGGSLYLLQLAKTYASNDQSVFPVIFNLALASEYVVLLCINFKNATLQIKKMRMMVQSEDLIPRSYIPGLELKIRQITAYKRVICVFYATRVMYEIYLTILQAANSTDEYHLLIVGSWRETIDLFNFSYLLWEFRPRKEWPEFFGLGVDQFLYRFEPGNRVGRQNTNTIEAQRPINVFHVKNGDIFDNQYEKTQDTEDLDDTSKDFFALLNTNDPILVLNPCDTTLPDFEYTTQGNPYINDVDQADEHYKLQMFHQMKVAFVDKQ